MEYEERCLQASEDQGTAEIQRLLEARGVKGYVWQSGGFCMVYTLEGVNGSTIQANGWGASFYASQEDLENVNYVDLIEGDESNPDPAQIAEAIFENLHLLGWFLTGCEECVENNQMTCGGDSCGWWHCGNPGTFYYFEQIECTQCGSVIDVSQRGAEKIKEKK